MRFCIGFANPFYLKPLEKCGCVVQLYLTSQNMAWQPQYQLDGKLHCASTVLISFLCSPQVQTVHRWHSMYSIHHTESS